ncbi:hypothetical protein CANARDRAFT_181507, partial [[Candida] arabinofermentans NRRL YB-2248]
MSGFWRFTSNYASRVTKILEKPDFELEELLDEQETIPELLASNSKLIEYLREPEVLEALVDYIVEDDEFQKKEQNLIQEELNNKEISTIEQQNNSDNQDEHVEVEEEEEDEDREGSYDDYLDDDDDDDDDDESFGYDMNMEGDENKNDDEIDEEEEDEDESLAEQHSRRAQVAAEILSVDVWSLTDAFMENVGLLEKLWSILDKPAPLPIFLATYFMKINEHLLDMKMDEMIMFILQEPYLIERFMRHIDTPPLMDFLLKVISTDKPDSSTGIIELLKDQGLINALIAYLGPDVPSSVQSAAGDFLKAFITISANNAENTTIGPNELSRQLVSEPVVRELVSMMLHGGTGLSNGVGIVIEIIRKNNSDYDAVPVVYITVDSHPPTPRDSIYLGTLVRVFSESMGEFTKMLERKVDKVLETPFGNIEPLGFERFKICELVAELIHCSNMALLNHEKGEEIVRERDEIRESLIQQQKQMMRQSDLQSNDSNDDVDDDEDDDEVDISRDVENLRHIDENLLLDNSINDDDEQTEEQEMYDEDADLTLNQEEEDMLADNEYTIESDEMEKLLRRNPVVGDQLKIALYDNNVIITILNMFFKFPWNNFLHNVVFDIVQQILNASMEIGYNKYLAVDLFGRGDITRLIIEGHDKCIEYEKETGLRLGYMGHLTLIAEEVVKFTSLHLHTTKSSIIEEAIMLPGWTHYVNETLVETRNKYNAVLGNDEEIDEDEQDEEDEDELELELDPEDEGDQDHDRAYSYHHQQQQQQNGEEYDEDDDLDQDTDFDQFARYITQQMTKDGPDKSSDEDSEDEDSQQDGIVNSSIGGHPYHQMSSGGLDDDDFDDYEDPNDDGQSYVKENHPLYKADGSLNYKGVGSGISPISDSDSDDDLDVAIDGGKHDADDEN